MSEKIIYSIFTPEELKALMLEAFRNAFLETRQPKPDSDKHITIQEAANLLRVSRQTIHSYIRNGHLSKYKVGGQTRIERQEALGLIQKVK